ncbi:MAG: hypothetical protein Q8Q31_04800 [Nanoarchaeota archaeon]|nr:hypothetical protein [Nanoarchaeota archaeon]
MGEYEYRYPKDQWSEVFGTMLKAMNTHRKEYAADLQMLLGGWIRNRIELYGSEKSFSIEQLDKGARLQGQSPMAYIVYLFGQPTPEQWMKEFIACADFDFAGARQEAA